MAVKFVDIDKEDEIPKSDEGIASIGILIFTEGLANWVALRPGTGFQAQGVGVPTGLESGLWVTNAEYEETRTMGRGMRNVTLRSGGFFKATIDAIRSSWGMAGRPDADAIRVVGEISDRIYKLSQEAMLPEMKAMGFSDMRDMTQAIERASSLATGIATVNHNPLRLSGSDDKRVLDHFEKAWQPGMFIRGRRVEEADSVSLSFHFPKLSYAMRITEPPVPARASWQVAPRGNDQDVNVFFNETMGLKRPAVFRAACEPGDRPAPEFAQACANQGFGGADTFRSRFIPEEIVALSEYFDVAIESVACGGSWIPTATGKLLRNLEAAAGGAEAARASWSVGVAAENILTSALRDTKKAKAWTSGEAVWLAARDRAAMLPAISALYDVGAILISASSGTINVKCPADPEMLMLVVQAAWEAGVVLPLEEVEALEELGVPIPTDARLFGGNPVDYLLSMVVHKRNRNALWSLDAIQDQPRALREKRYRLVMRSNDAAGR
ncbi:hypothetical protein ACEUZ9_002846 [Paracoccus litorisediminis]|uniref:hypothetical protein n=1 Tax=Paracoccus litorisediminis TaxID=2006130 RepID=UPI00372FD0EA